MYPLAGFAVQSVTVTRLNPVQFQARVASLRARNLGIRPDLAMINSLAVEVLRLPGWCCIGRPQDRLILPDLFLPSGRVAAVHGPDLVYDFAFFNSVSHT